MNGVRLAWVAGALGLLVGCSGKYNVGQEPASSGGAKGSSGESSSTAGSTLASVGDDAAGGTSNGVGGAPNGVGGAPDGTGGDVSVGVGGTSGGSTPYAAAGAATVDYCGQTLPTSTPAVALATPLVVWNRVQLFLLGTSTGSPPMLPAKTTREWAGGLVDSTLDSLNGASAPGLSEFVSAWWPGTPNADSWASVIGDPTATLTDLLTTNAVLSPGSGLLTDPAVLKLDEITARGRFIDEHLICQQVPPPPPNTPALGPPQPGQTRREQLEQALVPTCRACHSLTDPIGESLEHYDSVGTFNKLDNGSPIDSSGTLPANGHVMSAITFASVNELGQKLAQDCGVFQCFTEQLLAYAETSAKLPKIGSTDSQVVGEIAFATSNGALRSLIHSIVQSDTFLRAK